MSNPIVTYEGYSGLMGGCVRSFASGANSSRIRLFQNNIYPTKNNVWSDFQECDFAGYVAIPVPAANDQGLTPLFIDIWRFAKVNFVMSALPTQICYGWWVDWVNPLSSLRQSLWCQRFDSPFLFSAPGTTLPITLTPGFSQA